MPLDNWMISPRFDMRSLAQGRVQPVDVFEDAIKSWILDYASKLAALNEPNAGMAVMLLVAAYPETIECYSTGCDSKNQSKRFFTSGMKRLFPEVTGLANDILDSVCDDLRNGLYHASMLKGNVVLVPEGEPITYTADVQLFRINPFAFLTRVQEHLTEYVARLRRASADDSELINFHKYWNERYPGSQQPAKRLTERAEPEIVTSTAAPISSHQVVSEL